MQSIAHPLNTNPQTETPHRSIAVTNIERGTGDTLATFTVKIGSVLIRNVSLRQGRNHAVYINFPSFKNEQGRWIHLIEITSPSLENFVHQAIYRAVQEATR